MELDPRLGNWRTGGWVVGGRKCGVNRGGIAKIGSMTLRLARNLFGSRPTPNPR